MNSDDPRQRDEPRISESEKGVHDLGRSVFLRSCHVCGSTTPSAVGKGGGPHARAGTTSGETLNIHLRWWLLLSRPSLRKRASSRAARDSGWSRKTAEFPSQCLPVVSRWGTNRSETAI